MEKGEILIILRKQIHGWNITEIQLEKGEILIILRTPVIGNARTKMISLERRTEGVVYQATVKEELRIGMGGQQGDEVDDLVEEARVLLGDELKATEEAGLVVQGLKVTTFEARMIGGVDAANKGFLLQRWQLVGEGVQQVG